MCHLSFVHLPLWALCSNTFPFKTFCLNYYYWVLQVLYIFWFELVCQIRASKIYFFYSVAYHDLNGFFGRLQYIIFYFLLILYVALLCKFCLFWRFSSIYYFKSFVFLDFMLKSMICFKFLFGLCCETKSEVYFLHIDVQLFQDYLL